MKLSELQPGKTYFVVEDGTKRQSGSGLPAFYVEKHTPERIELTISDKGVYVEFFTNKDDKIHSFEDYVRFQDVKITHDIEEGLFTSMEEVQKFIYSQIVDEYKIAPGRKEGGHICVGDNMFVVQHYDADPLICISVDEVTELITRDNGKKKAITFKTKEHTHHVDDEEVELKGKQYVNADCGSDAFMHQELIVAMSSLLKLVKKCESH